MTIRHSILIIILITTLITILSNLARVTFEFLWYSFNIPVFHVFIYGLVLGAVVMWLLLSTARTQRQQKKQIHNLQGAISSLQGDSKSSKH